MITITTFKAARCYSDGTVNNQGTYLKVFLKFQSDDFAYYKITYKQEGTETWKQLAADNQYWYDGSIVSSTAVLSYDYSYNIKLEIETDSTTEVRTAFIPTGFVLIDFNASGKGIAFGKSSEKANEMEIGMPIFDRYGTQILNGLAFYESNGSTNPNTTTEELILTTINTPDGGLFFIRTMFYAGKYSTVVRTQYAYPYNSAAKSVYYRSCNGSTWTAWVEQPVIISSGTSGIWTYRKYSDGTGEFFGKIPVANYDITSTLGGWYRGANLYESTDYAYPFTMTEAPALEVTFQTRNGLSAIAWIYSQDANTAQKYVPQCYLIRPVTGTGIQGNLNIIGKGKI